MSDPVSFDIAGPVPGPGLTVIEASAGTGKTWTLTSLVVRFVAEGLNLSEILAVTFTRMATGELRDRVRRRLTEAHDGLVARLAAGGPGGGPGSGGGAPGGGPGWDPGSGGAAPGGGPGWDPGPGGAAPGDDPGAGPGGGPGSGGAAPGGGDDPLVDVLFGAGPAAAAAAAVRLAVALADFDAATIATTHGFCQMVLHGLGSAGAAAADSALLEDPRDLVREVVDDIYLRRCVAGGPLPFDPPVARKAAEEAVRNGDTPIFEYPPGGASALLAEVAAEARDEVTRRLVADDQLTYDEMLTRLARTLDDPVRGAEAARRLARRYKVVLVDEFQDTDPVQWRIVRSAFAPPGSDPEAGTTLVLIGDPKQAIYAFRGADVHAYLDAATQADARFTLGECRRSDQPLLDAIRALFDPTYFGHEDIPFRPVQAPPGRQTAVMPGAAMRFRVVADQEPGTTKVKSGYHQKDSLVEWVAEDVAGDIKAFLGQDPEVPDGDGTRLLRAADVAVLTRDNRQALVVRDALRARGVPAVVAGTDDVFSSDAARAWLRLLDAIQEPASRSLLAALALSPFVGMTAAEVAAAGDDEWESLHARVHDWAGVLTDRGVGALYRRVAAATDLPARVLAVDGGERMITDLGHVSELLHAAAGAGQLGPASLRNWLAARQRAAGEEEADIEERSRRLDSDAAAVQVLTIHRAKGLEFDIVYCPFLWDPPKGDSGSGGPVVYHEPGTGTRMLDTGCLDKYGPEGKLYKEHTALAAAADEGESLRLMYVALTRARHRVVVWWGQGHRSGASPLARVLLYRDPGTGAVGRGPMQPKEATVREALFALRDRASEGAVSVVPAAIRPGVPDSVGAAGRPEATLEAARFERPLDEAWRRASYSSITAGAHRSDDPVGSEPEDAGITDEPPDQPEGIDDAPPVAPGPLRPSPWADLAGGATVGTYVHRIFELADFAADPLGPELAEARTRAGGSGVPDLPGGPLLAALEAALTTPLGGAVGDTALAAITRPDRLDELGFEFPVAGGDRPVGAVTTAALAASMARHLGPDDRMSAYPARLDRPDLASVLRGYLVGSLDLVFRHPPTPDGPARWYVVDYKTNWLGTTCEDYGPGALDEEMQHRHYPLQALIYMVALHRYLRWRLPAYQPDVHLGGVYYLFVRGMGGPDTPTVDGHRCGVFHWAVPPALVEDLSGLLDGPEGAR